MADVLTKKQRSYNMSRIRSHDTAAELLFVKMLKLTGITGWRRNSKVTGKPDMVFPAKKIAVFIDGCFWHKCPLDFKLPKTNRGFWLKKINANAKRDKKIGKKLREKGWKVIRIWEHDIKKKPEYCLSRLSRHHVSK